MVYILARVRSKPTNATATASSRYRCIAAIRDSDRFHLDVLDATHRFLETVRDPINSRIIQHELSKIDELWDEGAPIPVNEDDRRTLSPCSFIASVFVHVWNYSLDVPEGEALKIDPIAMTVENALFNPNVSPASPTRGRIFSIARILACIFADSSTLAFHQRMTMASQSSTSATLSLHNIATSISTASRMQRRRFPRWSLLAPSNMREPIALQRPGRTKSTSWKAGSSQKEMCERRLLFLLTRGS